MKIDRYFDLACCMCGKHRSTDYQMGLWEQNADGLRKKAKKEGWTTDKLTGRPVCPFCSKNSD